MIKVPISYLKSGMRLAKDVVLEDGRLLLLAGFVIKPLYLRKLEAFKIATVYIESTTFSSTNEFEEEVLYKQAASSIKECFILTRDNATVDISRIKISVNEILQKIIENETVMLQLTGVRDIDNYTFLHSVDVCIYSIIIGKKIGYNEDLLMALGMGAILHDIGKCKVSIDILQKPDKLTNNEFNQMRFHTALGCEIIKNSYHLSTRIGNIAFQHHERWDGSGYPLGTTTNTIDSLARIVALADVYDALTSDRVYKKRELPHIAAEYIKKNSGILFDPYIVEMFINSIAVYSEGTLVLLNTGELGSIISPGIIGSAKQKVYVFSNKSGHPVLQPYIVDLNERKDAEIIEVFL